MTICPACNRPIDPQGRVEMLERALRMLLDGDALIPRALNEWRDFARAALALQDIEALDEALAPFDPLLSEPIDEAQS